MKLFEAIEAADLDQITTIINNESEHVTEEHLLTAIQHADVDKPHCKMLFNGFKTPENIIPASCILTALEQSRIDIFLSILRINNPNAPTETSTARLQRTLSSRRIKQNDEAKYERHKVSFIDMIQETFSAEEKQQLRSILTSEDHLINAVLGETNLDDLLLIVTSENKHEHQQEHADTMSTGTPPPEVPTMNLDAPLSKHNSNNSLTSEDLKLNSSKSDVLNAFLEHPEDKKIDTELLKRQDSDSDTDTDTDTDTDDVQIQASKQKELEELEELEKLEKLESARQQQILAQQEAARRNVQPHLDELQAALSSTLEQRTYEKIQEPMNKFITLATDLALNADRTPEDISLFRKQVKTEVISEAQTALLEHESYFSFFCRKIMDALHALLNVLTPVFPTTKNSFFKTAPSIVSEQFEASQQAISTACGA